MECVGAYRSLHQDRHSSTSASAITPTSSSPSGGSTVPPASGRRPTCVTSGRRSGHVSSHRSVAFPRYSCWATSHSPPVSSHAPSVASASVARGINLRHVVAPDLLRFSCPCPGGMARGHRALETRSGRHPGDRGRARVGRGTVGHRCGGPQLLEPPTPRGVGPQGLSRLAPSRRPSMTPGPNVAHSSFASGIGSTRCLAHAWTAMASNG